jgi:nucleoside diphosphate kinase/adenylate kinase family enzyme
MDAFEAMAAIFHHLDDLYYSLYPYTAMRDRHVLFRPVHVLERTMLIMKPGYTQESLEQTAEAIRGAGFVEIAQIGKVLTETEAKKLFTTPEDVQIMIKGLCVIMVVEKLGAVTDLLLLLGPSSPNLAKQLAPESLRARFGESDRKNALYASPSPQQALVDIQLIFPMPFESERTLAIVKPDAFQYWDEINLILQENGFHILIKEQMTLSMQRAEEFYAQSHFAEVDDVENAGLAIEATHLSCGPVMVVLLYKPACVDSWNLLVGANDSKNPKTLRGRFASGPIANGFYGSANIAQADKDINFFFPQLPRAAVPSPEDVKTLIRSKASDATNAVSLHEVLVEGLTHLCQIKPTGLDAITELANWLLRNNPNQPLVEQPTEPEVTEAQVIPTAPHIVCLLGGSLSPELLELPILSAYQLINVGELITAVVNSGSELGRVLKATLMLGRPAPSHMVMTLLKGAMDKSTKSKFLLADFPLTLDLALAFEEQIAPISMLVYMDRDHQSRITEAEEKWTDVTVLRGERRAAILANIKAFHDDIEPVLEHFGVFGKLRTTTGDTYDMMDQIQNLFAERAVAVPDQAQEMPIPPRRQVEKPKLDEDD